MQEYYTIFDRTNMQIGWAKVNKKTCGSVYTPEVRKKLLKQKEIMKQRGM